MTKQTHEQLMKIALSRPGVKREYNSLREEFNQLEAKIKSRLEKDKKRKEKSHGK